MLTRLGVTAAFVVLAAALLLLGLIMVCRVWRWARPPDPNLSEADQVDAAWRDSPPDVVALRPRTSGSLFDPVTPTSAVASITCPRCAMASYNPSDVRHGYCGNCHDFTGPYNGPARRAAPPPHLGRQLPRHPEEP